MNVLWGSGTTPTVVLGDDDVVDPELFGTVVVVVVVVVRRPVGIVVVVFKGTVGRRSYALPISSNDEVDLSIGKERHLFVHGRRFTGRYLASSAARASFPARHSIVVC